MLSEQGRLVAQNREFKEVREVKEFSDGTSSVCLFGFRETIVDGTMKNRASLKLA